MTFFNLHLFMIIYSKYYEGANNKLISIITTQKHQSFQYLQRESQVTSEIPAVKIKTRTPSSDGCSRIKKNSEQTRLRNKTNSLPKQLFL